MAPSCNIYLAETADFIVCLHGMTQSKVAFLFSNQKRETTFIIYNLLSDKSQGPLLHSTDLLHIDNFGIF